MATKSGEIGVRVLMIIKGLLLISFGIAISILMNQMIAKLNEIFESEGEQKMSHIYWLYGIWYLKVGVTFLVSGSCHRRASYILSVVFSVIALIGMGIVTIRAMSVWKIWTGHDLCVDHTGYETHLSNLCKDIQSEGRGLTLCLILGWITNLVGLICACIGISLTRVVCRGQIVIASNPNIIVGTQATTSGPGHYSMHPAINDGGRYPIGEAMPPQYAYEDPRGTRDKKHLINNVY